MAIVLREAFVDQFGTLDENGGWFGGGNGIAEAGEAFKYKGSKYVLQQQDVSSYEGFAAFLERVTSAKVDVINNSRGGPRYFAYRHFRDGIKIVDPNSSQNIFGAYALETPNKSAFDADFATLTFRFTRCGDVEGFAKLVIVYNSLLKSADVYANEVRDYQQDLNEFHGRDQLNAGDVEGFLRRTDIYNTVAKSYHAAKSAFYYYSTPVDRCPVEESPYEPYPIPPSNPRPIPPSEPRPIPDNDGNNPDEVDDI